MIILLVLLRLQKAKNIIGPRHRFYLAYLKTFDQPDCYRALAVKNLRMVEPWDAMAGKEGRLD